MSVERMRFESEIKKPSPNWGTTAAPYSGAIHDLNALNMTEMLATLNRVAPPRRPDVLANAEAVLKKGLGWTGSFDRIRFALDVVTNRKITWYPDDLPDDQADDARNFLESLLKSARTRAGSAVFDYANYAAIAAIEEINPLSVAVDAEYAGSIFESGGMFGFSKPRRGTVTRVGGKWTLSSDSSVPVPIGTKVAMYHTHGGGIANAGAEFFSGDDIMVAIARKQMSYLGTPLGRVKKITPNDLLPPSERPPGASFGFKQETLR